MQIDELPAGEQTQNPDLDMNQVVGTHDILMLCFDTLRYDVSKEEEEAGRTPVLNSHGGEWEKRHAPGNFTYPSHFAIFAGFLPSPAEPHSLRSRKWLFFPVQAGLRSLLGSIESAFETFCPARQKSCVGFRLEYQQ